MADLPEMFLRRMKELLREDYEPFLRGFDGRRQYGLRVNTSKISLEEFERIAPFHLKKIPWIPDGYFYKEEDAPARHPFYAAGLYYLQEPSAMTPASRLKVKPGEKVLDLCAAPGGKATALGANLKGRGFLVANDINTARARALLRNLELFGISCSFVTNEPPYGLTEHFPEYFDKIMVDAPCSGEGMFRKNPAVMDSWKEKGPEYFSGLQKDIVLQAADMLKPGGQMFYSTCTFAPEENERIVTHLLKERPEMMVIPMEDYEGFAQGITSFAGESFEESCRLCRRIWPHRMAGEGHFLALLQKRREEPADSRREPAGKKSKQPHRTSESKPKLWWNQIRGLGREQREALGAFFTHVKWVIRPEQIDIRADKVYYVPEENREDKKIHFLRNGIYLGDLKKKRFEPSQPFALALSRETYDQVIDFLPEDERLSRYLRGESLDISDITEKKRAEGSPLSGGWYLVAAAGYALGFGKLSGNQLKNKYPPGWRRNH